MIRSTKTIASGIWIIASMVLMAQSKASGMATLTQRPGELKGYASINRLIRAQTIRPDAKFNLGRYLGEDTENASGLLSLLGAYTGGGTQSEFRNGQANAVNILLWTVLFRGFGDELGRVCETTGDTKLFQESIEEIVRRACSAPSAFASSESSLFELWVALTAFEVPIEEFSAWREFVITSAAFRRSPAERVSSWVFSALMNPYFLLQN